MTSELDLLEDALVRLQEANAKLNALDDELTAKIPRVEDALKGLKLGVPISVTIDEGPEWTKCLSYDKVGGTWRLVIEEGPDAGDPDDWSQTPLASAPRDERADVFRRHLVRLLLSAADQVNQKAEDRRAIMANVDAVMGTIAKVRRPKEGA